MSSFAEFREAADTALSCELWFNPEIREGYLYELDHGGWTVYPGPRSFDHQKGTYKRVLIVFPLPEDSP